MARSISPRPQPSARISQRSCERTRRGSPVQRSVCLFAIALRSIQSLFHHSSPSEYHCNQGRTGSGFFDGEALHIRDELDANEGLEAGRGWFDPSPPGRSRGWDLGGGRFLLCRRASDPNGSASMIRANLCGLNEPINEISRLRIGCALLAWAQQPETPSVWRALVSFALVIPLLITLGAVGTCIASLWMAFKGDTRKRTIR